MTCNSVMTAQKQEAKCKKDRICPQNKTLLVQSHNHSKQWTVVTLVTMIVMVTVGTFVALRTKVTMLNQKINCSVIKDYWKLEDGTNRLSQDVGNQ